MDKKRWECTIIVATENITHQKPNVSIVHLHSTARGEEPLARVEIEGEWNDQTDLGPVCKNKSTGARLCQVVHLAAQNFTDRALIRDRREAKDADDKSKNASSLHEQYSASSTPRKIIIKTNIITTTLVGEG